MEETLERILSSKPFAQSPRMQRFLRYAVERQAAGEREALKEYTIGVEVFDRPAGYDPRIDSIVRVEARRLRKKLQEYYANEGRGEETRITLPEGSYVPVSEASKVYLSATEAAGAPEPGPGMRVAVLPFVATPAKGELEAFADSLTEEVIHALSREPSLRVVARSTAFQYKGRGVDAAGAAAELKVDRVVEGTVRRLGKQLKISVQLVHAGDGLTEWSESYGRAERQAFETQEEIARSVAAVLRGHASGETPKEVHVVPGEAYHHLLEGKHFAARMTPGALRRSIECFQHAIQLDGVYASAFAGLAGSVLQLALFGGVAPSVAIPDASQAVYKAMRLNPDLAEAHLWRAFLSAVFHWQWDEAEVDYQRALELNPNLVQARVYYAFTVMVPHGRFLEARAHLGAAQLLDPASPVLQTAIAMTEAYSGDLEAAEGHCRKAMEAQPDYYGAHRTLAFTLLGMGRGEEALGVLEKARAIAPEDPRLVASLGYLHARMGNKKEARAIGARLDQEAARKYVSAWDRALIRIGLGQLEEACRLLQEARSEHESWLTMVKVDPLYEPLRGRAGFEELVGSLFPEG